ncbi:hypothetical protein OH76DRAFT_1203137 [Lentinus brumalis]|uniref:Uncharacterized protein n=1 Tax=Lentinus brumalis TaxID=2498619 RepID=A0A371CSY5_9APHY|nr:hypothetical protein OH76DRAFT_1203137 [Polyporus brumalis]
MTRGLYSYVRRQPDHATHEQRMLTLRGTLACFCQNQTRLQRSAMRGSSAKSPTSSILLSSSGSTSIRAAILTPSGGRITSSASSSESEDDMETSSAVINVYVGHCSERHLPSLCSWLARPSALT